jgi:cytochrome c-type biogenesis protein CcmF
VRIWVKPFVAWIWIGCVFMGLGGMLAITDRRYRSRATRTEEKLSADGLATTVAVAR